MVDVDELKKTNASLEVEIEAIEVEIDRVVKNNNEEYHKLDKKYKDAWKKRYKIIEDAESQHKVLLKYLRCNDCQSIRGKDICRLIFERSWGDYLEEFLIEGKSIDLIVKNIKKIKLKHVHGEYSICTHFELNYSVISNIVHEYFPHTFTQKEYTPPSGYSDALDPYGTPGYWSTVTYNDQDSLRNIREKLLDKDQTKVDEYIKQASMRLKDYSIKNPHEIILEYVENKIKD